MDVINNLSINTASKFILPMVMKLDLKYTDVPHTFYKTCISIFDRPEFDDHIILISTAPKTIPKWRGDLLRKHIQYEEHKNYLFIFDIPKEFEDDYYKIVVGDYTNLSTTYKRRLLSFWEESDTSPLYGVLYHIPELRFKRNTYLMNQRRIEQARSFYIAPPIRELIYGLNY